MGLFSGVLNAFKEIVQDVFTFKPLELSVPREYEMTPIERKMYYALKRAGYDPFPQYRVCGYRLDFAVFENGIKLDIECDGKEYHSAPWQKAHDRKRTRVLNHNGWKVIRFTGSQIHKDVNKCIVRVNKKVGNSSFWFLH